MIRIVLFFSALSISPFLWSQASVQGWKYQIELEQDSEGEVQVAYIKTDIPFSGEDPEPVYEMINESETRLSVEFVTPAEASKLTPWMINDGRLSVLNLVLSRDTPQKKGYQMLLSYYLYSNYNIQTDLRYPGNPLAPQSRYPLLPSGY